MLNTQIPVISWFNLGVAFIPTVGVLVILLRWSLQANSALNALLRMLIQLLMVGYFLNFVFAASELWILLLIFSVMISAAGWIALRTVPLPRQELLWHSIVSILLAGGGLLLLVTVGVLDLDPWYQPRYSIPLAGMIFANGMTSISLCAERLYSESRSETSYIAARDRSYQAALIPVVNSLFAVGIVSLPGMMTGQILSGVSPLIAVRYQIMVMCMLFASAGLTTYIFLWLAGEKVYYHQKNN